MISIDDLQQRCRNKKDLQRGCVTQGWWVPPNKSPMCTLKFLQEVIRGDCYCPMLEEIKFKVCLCPPSMDELVAIYEQYLNERKWASEKEFKPYDRLLAHLKNSQPDKHWFLGVLSLLTPKHAIFQPGYRPRVREVVQHAPYMVKDPNGFFMKMQPLSAKEIRKRGGYINPMTKREKAEMALERLQEKEEKIQLAKQKKQADLLLLNDQDDGFKVRVSMADYEVLKRAKLA